jgi:hypothetical protein
METLKINYQVDLRMQIDEHLSRWMFEAMPGDIILRPRPKTKEDGN